jgi:hypothetical protein
MGVKSGGESGTVLGNWRGDEFGNGQELRSDKEGKYTLDSRIDRELGFMPRASCLTFKVHRQPQVVHGPGQCDDPVTNAWWLCWCRRIWEARLVVRIWHNYCDLFARVLFVEVDVLIGCTFAG